MNIGFVGLGQAGLVSALCLSEKFHVYGYDIDTDKMEKLKNGFVPFQEPKLQDILLRNLGKTFFPTNLKTLVKKCKNIFLALPVKTINISEDVKYLDSVIEKFVSISMERKTIIIKSTVLPGTCASLQDIFRGLDIIMNPEFLVEGNAVEDFKNPGMVVIGGSSKEAIQDVCEIYKPFSNKIVATNLQTAEFIKYLYNCLLTTLVSYSNCMADIGEKFNVDIKFAFNALNFDAKLKAKIWNFIYPGCGYGGSCFPKDINAITIEGKNHGAYVKLLESVQTTNDVRITKLAEQIIIKVSHDHNIKNIGFAGVAFKNGTSDIRNSIACKLVERPFGSGSCHYPIYIYDPESQASLSFKEKYPKTIKLDSLEELIDRSDLIVLLTKSPEFLKLKNCGKQVIDGRYFL